MAAVETARLYLRRLQPGDMDAYYRCIYADRAGLCRVRRLTRVCLSPW
jgi:hypothetical protein